MIDDGNRLLGFIRNGNTQKYLVFTETRANAEKTNEPILRQRFKREFEL